MILHVDTRETMTLWPLLAPQLYQILAVYFSINPRLFHLRFWIFPISLHSTWSLCTRYAFSNPSLNFVVGTVGATMAIKIVELGMLKEPPRKNGSEACKREAVVCWECMANANEYLGDPRRMYWNKHPCERVVEDTRREDSLFGFCIETFVLALKHGLYTDALLTFITRTNLKGGSIFRDTFTITKNYTIRLPHPFLGALPVTLALGFMIINILQCLHKVATLLAAPTAKSQSASWLKKEWPPLFDSPHRAATLRDFWANRWQGTSRHGFAMTGGRPGRVLGAYIGRVVDALVSTRDGRISLLGSRVGYVMGTFLMSGLIHDCGTWGMGREMDLCRVTGYFLLQGVGIVLEDVLGLDEASERGVNENGARVENGANLSSSEIRRWIKLVWVPLWVVLPATMMAEAWVRRGFAILSYPCSPTGALWDAWDKFMF